MYPDEEIDRQLEEKALKSLENLVKYGILDIVDEKPVLTEEYAKFSKDEAITRFNDAFISDFMNELDNKEKISAQDLEVMKEETSILSWVFSRLLIHGEHLDKIEDTIPPQELWRMAVLVNGVRKGAWEVKHGENIQ